MRWSWIWFGMLFNHIKKFDPYFWKISEIFFFVRGGIWHFFIDRGVAGVSKVGTVPHLYGSTYQSAGHVIITFIIEFTPLMMPMTAHQKFNIKSDLLRFHLNLQRSLLRLLPLFLHRHRRHRHRCQIWNFLISNFNFQCNRQLLGNSSMFPVTDVMVHSPDQWSCHRHNLLCCEEGEKLSAQDIDQ